MSRRCRCDDRLVVVPVLSECDRGDTLLEVLIALVIIGLTAAALLTAFATAITSSRVHRDIATNDQVLRSVTETAFSQIQQDASPKYISCGTPADYQPYFDPSAALPTGSPLSALYAKYQITVDPPVKYWDSSSNGFITTCPQGSTAPQLITITMTPPYGSPVTFQLTVASQGSVSSVTVMSASPTSASIGSTPSVTVYGSGFNAGATATFNCQGAAYPATTSTVNSGGTAITATLDLSSAQPGDCTISVVNLNGTTGTSGTIFAIVGPVAKFRVNVPSFAYQGMPFSVTLTAEDSAGNVVTSYSGSPTIGWSCTNNSSSCTGSGLPSSNSVSFSGGTSAAIPVTLNDLGSNVITATESSPSSGIAGSNSVSVAPLYLNWSNPQVNSGSTCVVGSNLTTALSYTGCGNSPFTFSGTVTLVNANGSQVTNTGNPITVAVAGPSNTTLSVPTGSSTTTQFSERVTVPSNSMVSITVSSSFASITATFKQ